MTELPPFELGHARTELRRQLVAAVLAAEKTATAGLWSEYEAEGQPLDAPGTRYLLHDYDDQPVGLVEVTEARRVRAADVDLAFARDEGEGFESVEDWRVAHEQFFEQPLEPDTEIVAVRFRLVERL